MIKKFLMCLFGTKYMPADQFNAIFESRPFGKNDRITMPIKGAFFLVRQRSLFRGRQYFQLPDMSHYHE